MIRDTIYTIPISDVFEPKCGCPICRLRDMLTNRCIDYVMGAAMMEPDIRIETNKYGFCTEHFSMLSLQKNKLSLALMLETHLDEISKKHMPPSIKKGNQTPNDTCYVCKEINMAMDKMLDTTLKLYFADMSFKKTVDEQEFFCYPHYELLIKKSAEKLNKKQAAALEQILTDITKKYMQRLRDNVHLFSTMFDYRNTNAAQDNEEIKLSIEKSIAFLTGK